MGVYRKPESPFWYMFLEGSGPKPIRTSTGIPVHGGSPEHNKELRRQAQEVYAARMAALARQRHGLSPDPAVEPPSPPPPVVTLRPFAAWYATHVVAAHRGAERERELVAMLLAKRVNEDGIDVALADLPLDGITRERVTEWMTARRRTASARTVNREIDVLKAMLRKAAELGHLTVSPLVGMKRLRVVPPKRRLLEAAEELRLLAVADPIDAALLILGIDTLVRFGDLVDLRREDVRGAWAYISDPKDPIQGEPYEVPLSMRARRALRAIPGSESYYFARYRVAALERDRRGAWRQKLKKLCQAAGVPYGRKQGGITFHWATRRTGATRLIRRRVDLKTVQALGHWKQPDVVLAIYTEVERRALLQAVRPARTGLPDSPPIHQRRPTRPKSRQSRS